VPHIIIEYSSNLTPSGTIDQLVTGVYQATLASGIAGVAGVRVRAVEQCDYRVADNHPSRAFVAMVLRLGPGRTTEAKLELINAVLDAGEQALQSVARSSPDVSDGDVFDIAWSAEVQEIDATHRINRNHIAPMLDPN